MLTTTPTTHLDPGLTTAHLAWLQARFSNRTKFFIETVTLPDHLSSLDHALYGPLVGDPPVAEADVFYAPNGLRAWRSRLIHKPTRPTRLLTVIGGPDSSGRMVFFNVFGGPVPAQEVGDPATLDSKESHRFWREHALAAPTGAPRLNILLRRPRNADVEAIVVDRGEGVRSGRFVSATATARSLASCEWFWGHYFNDLAEAVEHFTNEQPT